MEQQQQDYLGMDTIVAALSGLSAPEFEEVCGRANAARAAILAEQQNAPMSDIDGADDDGAAAPAPDGSEMDDEQASPQPVVAPPAPPAPGAPEIVAMSDDNIADASGEGVKRRDFRVKVALRRQNWLQAVRASGYLVFEWDTETTGTVTAYDQPIEIAAINVATGKTFLRYALPTVAISAGATAVHGYRLEDLERLGAQHVSEVLSEFLGFVEAEAAGRSVVFVNHTMFDVELVCNVFQKFDLSTDIFARAFYLDTYTIAKKTIGVADLDDDGHSLGALHKQLTGQELVDAHSAKGDAIGTGEVAACEFENSGCASLEAFLQQRGCSYDVPLRVDVDVEGAATSGGKLIKRMGAEGMEAFRKAWEAGGEISLDEGMKFCFDNPGEHPYWNSPKRALMLADTARALLSAGARPAAAFELEPPVGAGPFAAEGFYFAVPECSNDPAERERRWEDAFREFEERNGWSLRATEAKLIDFKNPRHCEIREMWFLKWNGLAGGRGRRVWCLRTDLSWNKMVEVMEREEGADFKKWLDGFDETCAAFAAESRPQRPASCEHCAAMRIAGLRARRSPSGRFAVSTFSGRDRYLLPGAAPASSHPLPAAGSADLVPDHIKGTPILRCWACQSCNTQLTPTYDLSSSVRASLYGAADASNLRADRVSTTPAGPA